MGGFLNRGGGRCDTLGGKMNAYNPINDTFEKIIKTLQHENESLREKLSRLEPVLKRIAEWGCNGQCVELCGTKCPCCIAQEAIAAAKEE